MSNPTEITIIQPTETTNMTREEAQTCVDQIAAHLVGARRLIDELDERRGWEALGYRSFYQCVINLFSSEKSQLYRQRAAARVESIIAGNGSVGLIPERVLRPLTPYVDQP